MDSALVAGEYASHLTEADVRLLLSATRQERPRSGDRQQPGGARPDGGGRPPGPARPAGGGLAPEEVAGLLSDPRVARAVLGEVTPGGPAVPAAPASPFLVFAVIMHRSAAELAGVGHVPERTGPRQRIPLFDAPDLRDFLGSPARLLFLAELLASFTRVASGRYRVKVRGQVRTRRFSELDPVRLAGLLDAVPEAERPGVYRRLGDVALFLAGVFPDYATLHALGPVDTARLVRAARIPPAERDRLSGTPAIELLEHLGARWYRACWQLAPVHTARLGVVTEVADRFRPARRVLNHVADQYLFRDGNSWFPQPEG